MIEVAIQNNFRLEMYQNSVFFNKLFLILEYQNNLKTQKYNFTQKKNNF
jgi:hypothetical protein